MNKPERIDNLEELVCEECGNDNFNEDEGYTYCSECGLEYGRVYSEDERRAYTSTEISNRRKNEPVWRVFGPRTTFTQLDINKLSPKKKALFSRLSKINNSLVTSNERNYWDAKPKLIKLANKLGIPDYIEETAWKIYKEVVDQKLTIGRSIMGFVATSLYASIRVHNFPRMLEEVIYESLVATRTTRKCLSLVIRNVLPKLNMKYRTISPKPLIYRFGNDLGLSMDVQQAAVSLFNKASNNGLPKIGKDPKGIAAAVLYFTCYGTKEQKTQEQVAKASSITEVTLRARIQDINEHL